MALVGQAVSERKTFESYCHKHLYNSREKKTIFLGQMLFKTNSISGKDHLFFTISVVNFTVNLFWIKYFILVELDFIFKCQRV